MISKRIPEQDRCRDKACPLKDAKEICLTHYRLQRVLVSCLPETLMWKMDCAQLAADRAFIDAVTLQVPQTRPQMSAEHGKCVQEEHPGRRDERTAPRRAQNGPPWRKMKQVPGDKVIASGSAIHPRCAGILGSVCSSRRAIELAPRQRHGNVSQPRSKPEAAAAAYSRFPPHQ
ncbi:hypothetical protein SKAU_G00304390 [Synaphobranchus kaupii]|uniref:Uncharacterized protein n=1 Tax=Synaphobranchus kaupii TaxID=118154 RepID=A0A9Q1EWF0_SYNKA|nr:hypothetical protein SKAU_G00304390 [Synaphobranchus kaupii]